MQPSNTNHESDRSLAFDRRRFERRTLVKPCKVVHEPSGRPVAGRTSNVSDGGALLCVDASRPMAAGDEVSVGVAWDDAALIRSDLLLPARVVRVMAVDRHTQAIAVRFDCAVELAAAA